MTDSHLITGKAAPLDIANLDTGQIMPKQFLRRIDKKGLDKGVLWNLRFDGEGQVRPEFVLNRPEYIDTEILLAEYWGITLTIADKSIKPPDISRQTATIKSLD